MQQIATNDFGYPERRNFIDLPYSFVFRKERDLFTLLLNFYYRLFKRVHPALQFLHFNILPGAELKHFFNAISLSHKFIVTYETTLPRLGKAPKWLYKAAVRSLASEKCVKIIAISQCTYNLQCVYMKGNFPDLAATIAGKTIILHPPQKLLISDYSLKDLPEEKIVFTIVGKDFFRKGGREVLIVFDKLLDLFPLLHLNIVSSLAFGDYASGTTMHDKMWALEIINSRKANMHHYTSLTNKEVLDLFVKSHVGLLPTWGETYGYSVLEAQAAGCPVISTDIRALPEINNEEVGWLISVPWNDEGNGRVSSNEERSIYARILVRELERIITGIVNDTQIIRQKGEKAMARILRDHDPLINAGVLKKIYEENLMEAG